MENKKIVHGKYFHFKKFGYPCTALDVKVVSLLQQSLLAKSAEEAGAALKHAYDRKVRQSWEACNAEGIEFVALLVETLGGWDSRAVKVIGKLGRQLARHTGK